MGVIISTCTLQVVCQKAGFEYLSQSSLRMSGTPVRIKTCLLKHVPYRCGV